MLERVLAYGDEWAPNAEPGIPPRIAELPRLAAASGRGAIPVAAMHIAAHPAMIPDRGKYGAEKDQ